MINIDELAQKIADSFYLNEFGKNKIKNLIKEYIPQDDNSTPKIDEQSLKNLMRDPRYWKHQDPEIVEQVRAGFRELYSKV